MKLYKTYLKWKIGEQYSFEEQLMLLRNGDYGEYKEMDSIQDIYMNKFEEFVSLQFSKKQLDLPNGIYRINKEFDSERYIYCEFSEGKMSNVYFDDYQINDVDYLLTIEREKQDMLFEGHKNIEDVFLEADEELERSDELEL